MFSGKEGMASDLAVALRQIQCRVVVVRIDEDPDPAILLIYADGGAPDKTMAELFKGGLHLPDGALACVDLRGDPVVVMVSKQADSALRDTLQDAIVTSLRANAQIGAVMRGTTAAAETPGKDLN